jgi:hypothetical protein
MKTARELLKEVYRDYLNNYITVNCYAERNGLTFKEADELIALARRVCYAPHPEQ